MLLTRGGGRRGAVLLGVLALMPAALFIGSGCSTDGTTPDCTLPESNCGADVDGAFDEASTEAAPMETGADAATDDADASLDAKIDGDANPG